MADTGKVLRSCWRLGLPHSLGSLDECPDAPRFPKHPVIRSSTYRKLLNSSVVASRELWLPYN
jgi:hypothetical protein